MNTICGRGNKLSNSSECLLTLVIPVYNEEAILKTSSQNIINYAAKKNWSVIFVDDGSTDQSYSILKNIDENPQVNILHHKLNRGYGAALKSGLATVSTTFVATMDADGQHRCEDIDRLLECAYNEEADLVIGNRGADFHQNFFRETGKWIIRKIAIALFSYRIQDLNSGMKLYRTSLVQKYLTLCPDSMAFSDVITLIFAYQKHLIREVPISIQPRQHGASTITVWTAAETLLEILNTIVMLNPLKVFGALALIAILSGVMWGAYLIIRFGRGVSVGSMLGIVTGLIFFTIGLLAHQISAMRLEIAIKEKGNNLNIAKQPVKKF